MVYWKIMATPADKSTTVTLFDMPPVFSASLVLQLSSQYGTVIALDCSLNVRSQGPVSVIFQTRSQAIAALTGLNGRTVLDHSMVAQLGDTKVRSSEPSHRLTTAPGAQVQLHNGNNQHTDPRNLYVLNISVDIDNNELRSLFSRAGSVVHTCILATLDSAGRRRAFVDLATHAAAKEAILLLNGTVVRGYRIDVSFAIVQRSGGPVSQSVDSHNKEVTAFSSDNFCDSREWPQPLNRGLSHSSAFNSSTSSFASQSTTSPIENTKASHLVNPTRLRTLQILKIPSDIKTDQELKILLSLFGTIEECHIQRDIYDGTYTSAGYVVFSNHREAENAHQSIKANCTGPFSSMVTNLAITDPAVHNFLRYSTSSFQAEQQKDIFYLPPEPADPSSFPPFQQKPFAKYPQDLGIVQTLQQQSDEARRISGGSSNTSFELMTPPQSWSMEELRSGQQEEFKTSNNTENMSRSW